MPCVSALDVTELSKELMHDISKSNAVDLIQTLSELNCDFLGGSIVPVGFPSTRAFSTFFLLLLKTKKTNHFIHSFCCVVMCRLSSLPHP